MLRISSVATALAATVLVAVARPVEAQRPSRPAQSPPVRQAPQVGEKAPDFTLRSLDGEEIFTLSDYRAAVKTEDGQVAGKNKPVVLFFGSYT